jgi:hypothetical protein
MLSLAKLRLNCCPYLRSDNIRLAADRNLQMAMNCAAHRIAQFLRPMGYAKIQLSDIQD